MPDRLAVYPAVEWRMVGLAFRLSLFQSLVSSVSWCDTVHIGPWYGPYRVLKRCISSDEKVAPECKLLIYKVLRKTLIFREFASEGKSARKFSFIFRGRTENSDGKTTGCWKSVSAPYCFHSDRKNNASSGPEPQTVYCDRQSQNFCRTVFCCANA